MGEISQLKPESVSVSKNLVLKKIRSFRLKVFGLRIGLSHLHFSLVTLNIDVEGRSLSSGPSSAQ